MNSPLLPAATPQEWCAVHLDHLMRVYDEPGFDETERVWLSIDDLFADDHAHLARVHKKIRTDDGSSAAAATKWVAVWYAGRLAHAVGLLHAFAGAGVVVSPDQVRFGLHPDGSTQLVDLGDVEVVVLDGHPWGGLLGVTTVADNAALDERVVSSLVAAARPILDAARRLGKVGLRALWAEIADELALTGIYRLDVPVDDAVVRRTHALLRDPSAPWRTLPDLHIAADTTESSYVGRKGGCCLAFQNTVHGLTEADEAGAAVAATDERTRVWNARFPPEPQAVAYCGCCSLRDLTDCQERQLFWLAQERVDLAQSDALQLPQGQA